MSEHQFGEAKNVVKFEGENLEFDKSGLEELFLHPEIKDRKIVVFSIVGAYRKGKSFFLDYCLRYLYANYKSVRNPENSLSDRSNWIGDANASLTGFSWRSGTQRDTTGIIFWSDVFLHETDKAEKLAIFLIDTQGLFDMKTTSEDNTKIFALSTLLSSVQILNLTNLIQEDQLQYLQFAIEYASFAANQNLGISKPFQKFMFLIRDFSNVDEYNFGLEGGQNYLTEVLQVKPNQKEEIRSVRQHVKQSFDQLLCCLMPWPGKTVARDSAYDGRWSQMEEDFLIELKILIPELMKRENLVIKKINGIEMTAGMFNDFVQQYLISFRSQTLPAPKSIYELTVDKFMTNLVTQCFEMYKKNLKEAESEQDIVLIHKYAKSVAIKGFVDTKKMGNSAHNSKYHQQLEAKIINEEIDWRALSMANIMRIQEEEKKAYEAELEAEKLRLQRIEDDRQSRIRIEQMQQEANAREEEAKRQRELLRQRQIEVDKELERQRIAEEQRQREIEEQKRIEEQRRQEEERRRQEEERRRREEEEQRRRVLFEVNIPHVLNFDVPRPKCLLM